MEPTNTRRRLLAGLSAAGTAALAGCTGSTPFVGRRLAESRTIDPEDAAAIAITGSAGDLTVTGDDREAIGLEIEKQSSSIRTDLEALELESTRDGDVLELQATYDGDTGWFESEPAMDLDVALPEALSVDRLRTGTGQVTVTDVTGDLEARSSTGSVEIRDVDGTVTAETSTGGIEIEDVAAVGDVTASTGSIEAAVPAIDGDTVLSASTGSVEVALSPTIDADLEARTGTGSLEIDADGLGLEEYRREDDRVSAALGEGGPRLRIETSTGEVSVSALEE
ncbi:DUF4097 family beta strand repeat-containing protein [Natronococcus jeotgali]|uniref:DUF4097 domain-containing protein n=1 Tax=Natronococcus jeotgali DSM 18795 TaxID=1227498 RepID=L9X2A4_9EURY|nr:DUF4097 family beta strand repeat-containing protein [Natronococcus jeotgali]ELY55742.1 hypothetical protein C492_15746 [Natronococcus jeotgali DSM 18795]